MPKTQQQLDPRTIEYAERQVLVLPDFPCPAQGWILDIGGGGDGIIGQLKGERVVSIDVLRSELEAVCNPALKVVMDARSMSFLDGTFVAAAAFFSLMYMAETDQALVFAEAFRVLRPGCELWVWDVAMRDPAATGKTMFMLPLTIALPSLCGDNLRIESGYGVPAKRQSLRRFADMAARAGFGVREASEKDSIIALRLRRGAQG